MNDGKHQSATSRSHHVSLASSKMRLCVLRWQCREREINLAKDRPERRTLMRSTTLFPSVTLVRNEFNGYLCEVGCVFVQPSVTRRSLPVHVVIQRCVALSVPNHFRVCSQNRKLISFATPPRMTPTPSSFWVTLQRMATAVRVRFFTTRTTAAECLNTCLLWPLRELSEPSHKNRLDSVAQCPGAIVTYLVVVEG